MSVLRLSRGPCRLCLGLPKIADQEAEGGTTIWSKRSFSRLFGSALARLGRKLPLAAGQLGIVGRAPFGRRWLNHCQRIGQASGIMASLNGEEIHALMQVRV